MCQPGWEGSLGENGYTHTHTHTYIWLSPFAVHLKLPQYCSLAIPQYKIISLMLKKKKKTEFSSENNNENNFVIILYIYKKILLFPPADATTDSIMTTWIGKGD